MTDFYRQLVLEAQRGGLGDLGRALLTLDNAGIRIEDFANILIINPQNGEVLKFDSTIGKWRNGTPLQGESNYQPSSTNLTALSEMSPLIGVPYQLAADVFSKIQIGTSANQIAPGDHAHVGVHALAVHYHDDIYSPLGHNHDTFYISVIPSPVGGNLPVMTAGGELATSAYNPTMFASSNLVITDNGSVVVTGDMATSLTIALANDSVSPGNSKVYGTSALGTKGWIDAPVGAGGGLMEATLAEARGGAAAVALSPSIFFSSQAPVALTDATTIAVDMNAGSVFTVTLAGNRTMGAPTNAKAGQSGEFWITQDATGGRTLAWHANYNVAIGEIALPTTANSVTVVAYRVLATNNIRLVTSTTIGAGGQITLAGTPDYITIANDVITRGLVDLTTDVTGNLPVGNLGSGTGADNTKYLRGDMTWAVPSGTGGYTTEEAQDAVGSILVDGNSVNFTYNDVTPTITADLVGDTAAPGNNMVYGTSATGVRGWQTMASGTVDLATVSEARSAVAGQVIDAAVLFSSREPVALTVSAGSTAVNMASGINFGLTLTANTTIANPTNVKFQDGVFRIIQDATGGRTVAWGTNWKFENDIPPFIPSSPNAWTIVPYYVYNTTTIICGSVKQTAYVLATVTETAALRTNTAVDRTNWVRWTNVESKLYTIASGIASAGDVWSGINAAATGPLVLVAGAGVTLTGTLEFTPGKSYSVRFSSASAADVVGGV